jgi:hypothetical protein
VTGPSVVIGPRPVSLKGRQFKGRLQNRRGGNPAAFRLLRRRSRQQAIVVVVGVGHSFLKGWPKGHRKGETAAPLFVETRQQPLCSAALVTLARSISYSIPITDVRWLCRAHEIKAWNRQLSWRLQNTLSAELLFFKS